jgi:hypothetical protein
MWRSTFYQHTWSLEPKGNLLSAVTGEELILRPIRLIQKHFSGFPAFHHERGATKSSGLPDIYYSCDIVG